MFAAVLEFVLAFQALNRKEMEEKLRDRTLDGEFDENDPRYRRHVDDKYQKEYDQHMKLYQTLVDLAEALSQKNAQAEVADEIENLSKLKDKELKKLIDEGYVWGVFGEF